MLPLEKKACNCFKTNLELEITPQEEEEQFQQSTICWLCEQLFTEGKVRDHDHLTGKYRGAAHSECNINVKQKQSSFVPVFSITFLGMIVILYLDNFYHKLTK